MAILCFFLVVTEKNTTFAKEMVHSEEEVMVMLRQAVEEKVGRKMKTPKDFDFLRGYLFDKSHEVVSTMTLKRIWGYVQSDSKPRESSIDPLAKLVGFASWEDYLNYIRKQDEATESETGEVESQPAPEGIDKTEREEADSDIQQGKKDKRARQRRWLFVAAVILLAGMLLLGISRAGHSADINYTSFDSIPPSGQRVLHKGDDAFREISQYLPLFGIENGDTAYYRPVPNLKKVFVWSPEYHHPVWHNDGDERQLLPTITEYWEPLPGTQPYQTEEYVSLANEKLYFEHLEDDELRITFMRDLVDSAYLFLGIYRMDREQSSKKRIVWRRVADDCDLGNLHYLDLLRK